MFAGKKSIIFDLDGTLIDSLRIWDYTDMEIIKYYTGNIVPLDIIRKNRNIILSTTNKPDIYIAYIEYLIEKYNIHDSKENVIEMRRNISNVYLAEKVVFKPGAYDLIKRLKDEGYILALATTTTRRCIDIYSNINIHTKKLDLYNTFDLILTKEDVEKPKPDPEIHNKILSYFNLEPDECIIFEDTYHGVQAGHNAGIEVIGVGNDDPVEIELLKSNADYYVPTLELNLFDKNTYQYKLTFY